ncbi:MAG TPA: alpha/beta hydrolase [Planktothrix sp.]|jgi:acetyl esterase/lipase
MLTALSIMAVSLLCGCASAENDSKKKADNPPPAKPVAVTPPFTAYQDIIYIPKSRLKAQTLDLYVPKGKKGEPLIVFIHGGGWVSGDKKDCPTDVILQRHVALASINYRLTDQAIFPAQIFDCKAAIRWLRANSKKYGYDAKKIGVWGSSAGGHLVALLGTTNGDKEEEGDKGNAKASSNVQAVCDWCGPTDLLTMADQAGAENDVGLKKPGNFVDKLLGGPAKEHEALAKMASPVYHVTKDCPPILILHGDKDNTVPYPQAQEFYKALQDAGVDSQMITIHGGGHGFASDDTFNSTMEFFDRVLRNKAKD